MTTEIDEKSTIPLKWMISLIASVFSIGVPLVALVFKSAVWMKSVDDRLLEFGDRLSAIEHSLGIQRYASKPDHSAEKFE